MTFFASSSSLRFNPRPREGGDMLRQLPGLRPWGFNPRPREGGDMLTYHRDLPDH